MKPRFRSWPCLCRITTALLWGTAVGFAQNAAPTEGGAANWRGLDPSRIQDFILQGYRDQLEIKDDAEWSVVRERIQKVLNARRETAFGGLGGLANMFRRGGRGGGAEGGPSGTGPGGGGPGAGGPGGGRGLAALLPPISPEQEALQKAIEAKAPAAELKAALAKFQEARRKQQALLEKAQTELREILTVRQEAIASVSGLL